METIINNLNFLDVSEYNGYKFFNLPFNKFFKACDFRLKDLLKIRGVVIKDGEIVARGFPLIPCAVAKTLRNFSDNFLHQYKPDEESEFYPRFDGIYINLTITDSGPLLTTQKTIIDEESDLYKSFYDCNPPDFIFEKTEGILTYIFLLVSKDFQSSSRYDIKEEFIVYIGAVNKDGEIVDHEFDLPKISKPAEKSGFYSLKRLSFEEAEELIVGKRDRDIRLSEGESVYYKTGNVNVFSVAYNWRREITKGTNLYRRFIVFHDYASRRQLRFIHPSCEGLNWLELFNGRRKRYSYHQLFPTISHENLFKIIESPSELERILKIRSRPETIGRRFINIAWCFAFAVPKHRIMDVIDFYPMFIESINRTVLKFSKMWFTRGVIYTRRYITWNYSPLVASRLLDILRLSVKFSYGSYEAFKYNFRYFLYNEYGGSLYLILEEVNASNRRLE